MPVSSHPAETQDARYLLDWLYEQAPSLHIERQEDSGVARDINAGLIGYSYGAATSLACRSWMTGSTPSYRTAPGIACYTVCCLVMP